MQRGAAQQGDKKMRPPKAVTEAMNSAPAELIAEKKEIGLGCSFMGKPAAEGHSERAKAFNAKVVALGFPELRVKEY